MTNAEFNTDSRPAPPEITSILDELERLAPVASAGGEKSVVYRLVEATESLNDALDEPEEIFDPEFEEQAWNEWQGQQQLPLLQHFEPGATAEVVPVVAIDSGLARLGETEDGLIIALRGTIVVVNNGDTTLNLYRTGPIYLRNSDRLEILHLLGMSLGKPDIFVELDGEKPIRIKAGVADDAQKYSDRFRNWFERVLQRLAVSSVANGLVLLDGALTLNTRDTPTTFLKALAEAATEQSNAIIGISKQSRLQVANRSVRFWLAQEPNAVCYRRLTPLMSAELRQRIMGGTYAIRFSPVGAAFRADVKPCDGQTEEEALGLLFGSCLIRGGYPDVLVRAHTHSYFTSPSMAVLQAQCGVKYRLRPEPEFELTGIFGPFGGRFK